MKVLLTNDDGIDAAGLGALRALAKDFFEEIWVVAPSGPRSQIGHRVTTDAPILYEQREDHVFAVDGTPADCVRVALAHLLPSRPDWVMSGINHGGNLGRHDFAISGTIAAVREATLAGVPGIALSHYLRKNLTLDWDIATGLIAGVLPELLEKIPGEGRLWNVNLPHLAPGDPQPRIVHCPQEGQALLVSFEESKPGELFYSGEYHQRPRRPGSDVDVCFGGDIAVTLAQI